jgi:hypothetical protein
MKTLTLLFLALTFSLLANANKSYVEIMEENIMKMYHAQTENELVAVANTFERISNAEPDKWIPVYYAAYSYLRITFFIEDGNLKDKHLDNAQVYIDKAIAINSSESEIYVLQAFLHQMRIYSASRGYTYSQYASSALDKAEKLNPDNPRLFYLRAQNIMNTPAMFGGGADKALPFFEKAQGKFESFKAQDSLWPNWGADKNAEMLKKCKEKE